MFKCVLPTLLLRQELGAQFGVSNLAGAAGDSDGSLIFELSVANDHKFVNFQMGYSLSGASLFAR
jgi:hypothetical protein